MTGGWNYPCVGATAGTLPSGYGHLHLLADVGRGRDDFRRAAAGLLGWQMHRRAGLTAEAGGPRAAPAMDVLIGWRAGPLRVSAPCRVVSVRDEARVAGFTYGTLHGHPEAGEEAFTVRLDDDGVVRLDILAFSRPARWYSRLGAPLTRLVQRRVTGRYVAALQDLAKG